MCTIIARNYLAHARVLARSFRGHNPGVEVFALIVDQLDGASAAGDEPFTAIRLDELPLAERASLCFKYTVLELCTAVKPFLLAHLLDRYGMREVMYLDPDILVLDTLAPLYGRLADHSIVLTPHITDPIDDAALPGETTFLQSGIYNLGFVAVADTPTTRRMLAWWQQRCHEQCTIRMEEGLFVDQKWMDLAPVLFEGVSIVTEPGYNVAYWNLHGRAIRRHVAGWTVNGEPLRFFHFSGYDPDLPASVSKHQTRWSMAALGNARGLFDEYRQRLLDAGYRTARQWPYGLGAFDNGVPVSPIVRDLYYRLGPERRRFGDPFATGAGGAFFAWLNAPALDEAASAPYISNLMAHIVNFRADLRSAFPDFRGRDRRAFLAWVRASAGAQLGLHPVFLRPLGEGGEDEGRDAGLMETARALSAGRCRVCPLLAVLDRYGIGERARAVAQRLFARTPAMGRPGAAGPARRPAAELALGTSVLDGQRPWLARIAGRVIETTLSPCARHHRLGNLLAPEPPALRGMSPIPTGSTAPPRQSDE